MTRRPFLLWHRWFGLGAAAWLFMLGLTGSLLVFYDEIDRGLNADLFAASPGPNRPVLELVNAAQRALPGAVITYLDLPNEPGDVAIARSQRAPRLPAAGPVPPSFDAYIDPAKGAVLGTRLSYEDADLSRRGIANFVYKLHYSLHMGERMVWIIGLIALLWVFDHVASLVLSFPNPKRWRKSFLIRRGASGHKMVFDWHRAGGLWLFPVTLTLAVSGVCFNWFDEFEAVVNAVSPVTQRADEGWPALANALVSPPVSFARALDAAGSAQVDGVSYNPDKGLYWLRVFDERDIDNNGRRWIFVDARSGDVLSDSHVAEGSAGDVVLAWQFPLHSGKAFGWWGRIVIFVSGMMLCVFIVTGVMMWNRKRRANGAVRERRQRTATEQSAGLSVPAK